MAGMAMKSDDCRSWFARLDLEFARRNKTTIPERNRHTGPLRLQRPLYPEDGVCHAYILHPPGGVVGGDRLELHTLVKKKAAALITTPGATKFYRSLGDEAVQKNFLKIEANGDLEWLPQETIVFPGANARTVTRIDLSEKAGFVGWEIVCLGLSACDQPFQYGSLDTIFEIYREGCPLYRDHFNVQGESGLHRPAGLRGFSVSATFLAVGCRPEMVEPLRAIVNAEPGMLAGITLMEDLLVARYLGDTSSEAKALFQKLWEWLRPHLSGRKACPPRIWAT